MGKRKASLSDVEKFEKTLRENQYLKREINRLRKELARIDIQRLEELEEIADRQEREEFEKETKEKKEQKLKNKWVCHKCGVDYLRLIIYNRIDGICYNRRCPTCGHKTKMKKYNENVEGIK